MNKIFIFVIIILMSMNAFSQEQESYYAKGDKSVLFSFSGLSNLSLQSYNNGIGGKYFLDDKMAIRVGLQLNGSSVTTPMNPDTTQFGMDAESSTSTFGISAAVEYHLRNQRISPFVGGGISLSMSSSETKQGVLWFKNTANLVTRTTTKTSGGLTYGLFALAGLEMFITKSFSLTAEYEFSFDHDSGNEVEVTRRAIQGTDPDLPFKDKTEGASTNTYRVQSTGLLTLAIYF